MGCATLAGGALFIGCDMLEAGEFNSCGCLIGGGAEAELMIVQPEDVGVAGVPTEATRSTGTARESPFTQASSSALAPLHDGGGAKPPRVCELVVGAVAAGAGANGLLTCERLLTVGGAAADVPKPAGGCVALPVVPIQP